MPPAKAAKPTVDQQVAAIRALDPTDPATRERLRDALRSGEWRVAVAAAKLAGAQAIYGVAEDLGAAYRRLDDGKRDPLYAARSEVIRTLDALARWDGELAARAVTTRVPPPPKSDEDAAAGLRVVGGFAYVSAGRPEALDVLATLLADRAPSVQVGAARALGACGRIEAAALVRYALLAGAIANLDALQALAEALLELQPDTAADVLARFLPDGDGRAEVVAVALGAARATACFEALVAWSNGLRPADRERVGFLPIALLRDDAANAWLAGRIADGAPADALAAARALATFAGDGAVAAQLRAAAEARRDAASRRAILALLT